MTLEESLAEIERLNQVIEQERLQHISEISRMESHQETLLKQLKEASDVLYLLGYTTGISI